MIGTWVTVTSVLMRRLKSWDGRARSYHNAQSTPGPRGKGELPYLASPSAPPGGRGSDGLECRARRSPSERGVYFRSRPVADGSCSPSGGSVAERLRGQHRRELSGALTGPAPRCPLRPSGPPPPEGEDLSPRPLTTEAVCKRAFQSVCRGGRSSAARDDGWPHDPSQVCMAWIRGPTPRMAITLLRL